MLDSGRRAVRARMGQADGPQRLAQLLGPGPFARGESEAGQSVGGRQGVLSGLHVEGVDQVLDEGEPAGRRSFRAHVRDVTALRRYRH